MSAAALRQYAASSNIANALSEPQNRLIVSQSALPDNGVSAKLNLTKQDAGDLVSDMVAQIGALYSFKANIISVRVADEMIGTTLSLRA